MTRKDWFTALGLLLLLWLLGGFVWRPVIEQALTKRAEQELSEMEGVDVVFSGQQAVLTGEVRWESQRVRAETLVRERIRASAPVSAGIGGGLNPVTDVVNEIEVKPLAPGWLLLAADGGEATLLGEVATPEEARDLASAIGLTWAEHGGRVTSAIEANLANYDEAPVVRDTLSTVPRPPVSIEGDRRFGLWAVRLGERWQPWSLSAVDEVMKRDGMDLGMTDEAWDVKARVAIQELLSKRATEKARIAEERRLAALPPPHVIAVWVANRLLLRGELGSSESKTAFLKEVIERFPNARVLDDLRVSAERRPVSMPTLNEPEEADDVPGHELVIGFPGKGWQAVKTSSDGGEAEWKTDLPEGVEVSMLQGDVQVVEAWMTGGNAGIPSLPAPPQPAFLTLAVLNDRVLVAGQLAEEAHRAALVEAIDRVYGIKREVDSSGLLVRGNCEAIEAVYHTILSLPPPGDRPLLAIAKPGGSWTQVTITEELLRERRISREDVPKGVPVSLVTGSLMPAFDRINAINSSEEIR